MSSEITFYFINIVSGAEKKLRQIIPLSLSQAMGGRSPEYPIWTSQGASHLVLAR